MTKQLIPNQEMLDDLSKIGDKDYAKKWGVSLRMPIKLRKRYGIKSFNPQHGTKRMSIEGVDHKWCPRGGGHWSPLSNFRLSPTRAGGYRGVCETHEKEDRLSIYYSNGGKEKAQAWRRTPGAKDSLRNTWRKEKAKKNNAYVKWDRKDEKKAYSIFDKRCGYCGVETAFSKIEFDHFIPISRGGKTEPSNMVPCCSVCNHGHGGKFNKDPEEWIMSRFHPEYSKIILKDVKHKLWLIETNYTV